MKEFIEVNNLYNGGSKRILLNLRTVAMIPVEPDVQGHHEITDLTGHSHLVVSHEDFRRILAAVEQL